MFNPQTKTFDNARGFLKAVRQEFPEVKASTGREAKCDVCTSGAVLLYCVRRNLVDVDRLIHAFDGDMDDPAKGWIPGPPLRPDEDQPHELWRFPSPWVVQELLMELNPLLDKDVAWRYASSIVTTNDAGKFDDAEALIEEALRWRP